MPDLRNFLSRFRPTATPGPPMPGGVPADRVAEREAELRPLLELLEDVQRQAEQIRADARTAADDHRRRARQQADAVLAAARLRADAERAAAGRGAAAAVSEERRRAQVEAAELARRVGERAERHLDGLAERAGASVLATLAAAADRRPGPAGPARPPDRPAAS